MPTMKAPYWVLWRRDKTGLPLLVPSGPRSTVHSSIVPNGSNIFRTSSSVCCFPSIPTKSFRSSGGWGIGGEECTGLLTTFPALHLHVHLLLLTLSPHPGEQWL